MAVTPAVVAAATAGPAGMAVAAGIRSRAAGVTAASTASAAAGTASAAGAADSGVSVIPA
ncbi:hypothetical protein ACT17_27170 [Mycolicibacterium conceptionense]|uniref:PE family protein n=1 Tax=Mycolicibacterium conceptionense TaxID=451644 RepID=A0A0J8U072_9MYCO|nr:hypothetical protein ACT17_27170 [Mycolicibacterium conceptionense]